MELFRRTRKNTKNFKEYDRLGKKESLEEWRKKLYMDEDIEWMKVHLRRFFGDDCIQLFST